MKVTNKSIFKCLAISGAAVILSASAIADSTWPTTTVKLVVPYSAGGTTDVTSRIIVDLMKDKLSNSENIIVENRPGAGSTKATGQLAAGRNVSHTLLMASPGHTIGPAIYPGLRYNPVDDFKFIRRVLVIPNVMVVPNSSPYKTVEQFVEAAKKQELTYGSPGLGSSIHMSGELFKTLAKVNLTHVPFRGSAEALPALLSGDVDVSFENISAAMPHIKAGKLRALAVTTSQRSPFLPDVPTVSEAGSNIGLETFEVSSWFGVIAHKSFDQNAYLKMQSVLDEVMKEKAFLDFLEQRGGVAGNESGDDFKKFIALEVDKWDEIAKIANIKR
jgi:tripartite-type tricarboxylate transporter receptor subunit TctC